MPPPTSAPTAPPLCAGRPPAARRGQSASAGAARRAAGAPASSATQTSTRSTISLQNSASARLVSPARLLVAAFGCLTGQLLGSCACRRPGSPLLLLCLAPCTSTLCPPSQLVQATTTVGPPHLTARSAAPHNRPAVTPAATRARARPATPAPTHAFAVRTHSRQQAWKRLISLVWRGFALGSCQQVIRQVTCPFFSPLASCAASTLKNCATNGLDCKARAARPTALHADPHIPWSLLSLKTHEAPLCCLVQACCSPLCEGKDLLGIFQSKCCDDEQPNVGCYPEKGEFCGACAAGRGPGWVCMQRTR